MLNVLVSSPVTWIIKRTGSPIATHLCRWISDRPTTNKSAPQALDDPKGDSDDEDASAKRSWWGARAVEWTGLENRRGPSGSPWVRIPPPPLEAVGVCFTEQTRASQRRAGFALGKKTRICNDLPRAAGRQAKLTVLQGRVRTGFPEEVALRCRILALGENTGLFTGSYEHHERFEPSAGVGRHCGPFLAQGLLLVYEVALGFSKLFDGEDVFHKGGHKSVELAVDLGDLSVDESKVGLEKIKGENKGTSLIFHLPRGVRCCEIAAPLSGYQ